MMREKAFTPHEVFAIESADNADTIIEILDRKGLGWSLDHTGNLREARIWDWPSVIGRYRPHDPMPLAEMLRRAIKEMV